MNFIETYFIKDLTLCDDIIEYFKNLPPNKKFEGRIGIRDSRIDHSRKQSIETVFDWEETSGSLARKYAEELHECTKQYIFLVLGI